MTVPAACTLQLKAADALLTLVQSKYPSATVLFTSSNRAAAGIGDTAISDVIDLLQKKLHAQTAAEPSLIVEEPGIRRFLAIRRVVAPGSLDDAPTPWWAPFYAVGYANSSLRDPPGSPSPRSLPLAFSSIKHRSLCCPDAVVYIDGVEVQDVAHVVAPTLVDAVTALGTPHRGGGVAPATHRGERRAPSYCRRKVDWAAIWKEKRCAMRGVDLLELLLPVSGDQVTSGDDVREPMLVSIANPAVTLGDLNRQRHAARRGPLRTSFGFSLPCVQAAVPEPMISAVRLVRRWQQRVWNCTPSTSAFWVSSFAHLLKDDVVDARSPLTQQAEACRWQSRELGMTETQVRHLSTIVQPGTERPSGSQLSPEEEAELLSFLLTSTALQVSSTMPLEAWNGTNYFLPAEKFDHTTDAEVVMRNMRGGGGIALTFPIFSSMYRAMHR